MAQLTIDNIGTFRDRLNKLSCDYGPITSLTAFIDWAVMRGLGDGMDAGMVFKKGLAFLVKTEMKRKANGLRVWICTGTAWILRENCTYQQHELYCRFLDKKRRQIEVTLELELSFHLDRWNREVVLNGDVEISPEIAEEEDAVLA